MEKKSNNFKIDIKEMEEAGLSIGHRKSASHPKMMPYISKEKSTIYLINLEKTADKLEQALEEIKKIREEGKTLILVGTKVQAKDLVKEVAEACKIPYVNERWLGGTITNFSIIRKRADYYLDLKEKKEKGELEKYTKKERLEIDRNLERLRIKFEGIKDLKSMPDAVFVLDIKKDKTAISEAKIKNILTFGLADTNDDPTLLDYPIPANNDAISSLKYILERIKQVLIETPIVSSVPKEEKEEQKN